MRRNKKRSSKSSKVSIEENLEIPQDEDTLNSGIDGKLIKLDESVDVTLEKAMSDAEDSQSDDDRLLSRNNKSQTRKRVVIYHRRKNIGRIKKTTRAKFDAFLQVLGDKNEEDSKNKVLKNCLAHMHPSVTPFWTSPSSIMKAIQHSLFTRNWNNLTHLVLIMLQFPCENYRPLIRHMCQIINELHPAALDEDLKDQLKLVYEANRNKRSVILKKNTKIKLNKD